MRNMSALTAISALASIGALNHPSNNDENYEPIGGRIVGRDNVKNAKKMQSRNSPCQCGSGRKAKKCCIFEKSKP